jgi:hypothetical protein
MVSNLAPLICAVLALGLANSANVEAETEFDGMVWYHSHDPSKLSVNADDQLEWVPGKPHTLYVRLAEHDLGQVGNSMTIAYVWHSIGDYLGCDCHDPPNCNFDDDVTCLAGTGDFRLGLFDSNTKGYVTGDYFGEKNPIFLGYIGYQWRFHPHVCDSERFIEQKPGGGTESHTNISCWKRDEPYIEPCGQELLGDCDPRPWVRIKDPEPACFNLGFDEWAMLTIEVERVSSSSLKTTFTFNGRTFNVTDSDSLYQPDKIDVFAVHFSNARPYDIVVLEATCKPPAGDLDGDRDEEWDDFGIFVDYWLDRCRPSEGYCQGADIDQDFKVTLADFALFAARWQDSCE